MLESGNVEISAVLTCHLMRAYLGTTGVLWALLAGAHVLRTVAEWDRVRSDPEFIVEAPGIGLLALALCIWAWRLFAQAGPRNRAV
jgi:hypothetical protein